MKDLEQFYNANHSKVYNELENDYLNKKEITADINHLLSKAFKEHDKRRSIYSKSISKLNIDVIRLELENILKEDKRITLNEGLSQVTENSKGLQNKIVEALSTINAFNDFNSLLRDEQDIVNKEQGRIKQIQEIEINWTNGNNKNDFVKIIYALHKAKLINEGKGDITKIVEQLGDVFNVGLSNSWQSNHTKSKTYTNNGYESLAIFDTLKDSYSKYIKEKNSK